MNKELEFFVVDAVQEMTTADCRVTFAFNVYSKELLYRIKHQKQCQVSSILFNVGEL